ncbi:hypothetical protein VO63_36820, partial [Streptomyces showdoensis]
MADGVAGAVAVSACCRTRGIGEPGTVTSDGSPPPGGSATGAPSGALLARCTGGVAGGVVPEAGGTTATRRLGIAGVRATVDGRPMVRGRTTARGAGAADGAGPGAGAGEAARSPCDAGAPAA